MWFNSWEYLVFFLLVAGAYFVLALRYQNVLLLAASYFFYGWWDWRFLGLLLVSTIVDFTVARRMESSGQGMRKTLLLVSVGTNLGILGFFKYFNFFADSASELLSTVGFQAHAATLNVILPVGISFYTFQTLGYTIDVYRRHLKAERDPVVFALYVSYFPQLVAGPIERATRLLPQFHARRRVTQDNLASGALLILIGLLRKVAIADVAANWVDGAFVDPASYGWSSLVKALVLFSLQIYGDFSGYSNIARGCSRILGIELMQNFNHPYFATNISVFWRKWHVSLSTWLRDYLYIPLGGSHGSRWFTNRNLMVTMLLGGLWHGAAWTFVVWGAIHGAALIVHKTWREMVDRNAAKLRATNRLLHFTSILLAWCTTMATVGVAWVFFRAADFGTAFQFISGIVTMQAGSLWIPTMPVVLLLLLLLLIDVPQALAARQEVVLSWPWPVRGVAYACSVLLLIGVADIGKNVAFIYFQF